MSKRDGNWQKTADDWRVECVYIANATDKKGKLPAFNNSTAVFRRYCEMQRDSAERNGFFDAATYIQECIDDLPPARNPLTRVKVGSKSQRTKAAPSKRLRARRRVTEKAPAGFYGNPLARVEVDSPSQRAHLSPRGKMTTKPDPRLIKRRTKTAKTRVKGVWANPAAKIAYLVFSAASDGIKHELLAHFPKKSAAVQYAQAWADMTGKRAVVESKKL